MLKSLNVVLACPRLFLSTQLHIVEWKWEIGDIRTLTDTDKATNTCIKLHSYSRNDFIAKKILKCLLKYFFSVYKNFTLLYMNF